MNSLPTFLTTFRQVFESRTILAGTLPALLAGGYGALLAQELTDWRVPELWSTSPTATVTLAILMLLALTVLIQALNAVFVKWLSGDAPWIPQWFVTRQTERRDEIDGKVKMLHDRYSNYRQGVIAWQQQLAPLTTANETTTDPSLIAQVATAAAEQPNIAADLVGPHGRLVAAVVTAVGKNAISETDLAATQFQLQQVFAVTKRAFGIEIAKQQGERYAQFPSDVVRGTRFGNRAIAVDSYIEKRYGMPTDVLCSRLRQIESTKDKWASVDDAKASLDFTVAFVWVNVAAATVLVALFPTVWRTNSTLLIALPIWIMLAWASYVASVQAVGEMGVRLAAVVDLYRWELLRALHVGEPKNAQEEFEAWNRLGGFIMASPRKEEREALWFR